MNGPPCWLRSRCLCCFYFSLPGCCGDPKNVKGVFGFPELFVCHKLIKIFSVFISQIFLNVPLKSTNKCWYYCRHVEIPLHAKIIFPGEKQFKLNQQMGNSPFVKISFCNRLTTLKTVMPCCLRTAAKCIGLPWVLLLVSRYFGRDKKCAASSSPRVLW